MAPKAPGSGEGDPREAADLTPEVRVTVDIRPGKPPPGLLTPEQERQLARLEKPFLDRLATRPAERAKFVNDPLGTVRGFSPAAKKLVDSLNVDGGHGEPTLPHVPGVKLTSLKVNVKRPPAPNRRVSPKPKPKPKQR